MEMVYKFLVNGLPVEAIYFPIRFDKSGAVHRRERFQGSSIGRTREPAARDRKRARSEE